MSFLLDNIYDIVFLVAFVLFVSVFLYTHRKNVKKEGIMILYRSSFGIKAINYIGTRYKKFLSYFEWVIIIFGYFLMGLAIYLMIQLIGIFSVPEYVRAIKIPPIMPLIPYLPALFKISFLPPLSFTYWIIVILVAAAPHEFFHGIFAKIHGVKIKSTGFAFLGPFAGAFVEPDEKQVNKIKPKHQIAFLGAGTFANLLVGFIFVAIFWMFFAGFFVPSGVIFSSYTASIINVSQIESINPIQVSLAFDGIKMNFTEIKVNGKNYYTLNETIDEAKKTGAEEIGAYQDTPALKAGLAGVIISFNGKKISTLKDLDKAMSNTKPGDEIVIKTLYNEAEKEYKLTLIEHPQNSTKGYLGIATVNVKEMSFLKRTINKLIFFKDPNTYYQPKFAGEFMLFIYNLLWWIVLVCFSVAIMNMLPLGPFDGGRVFYLTIIWITKSEKAAKIGYRLSTYFFLGVFLLITFLWFLYYVILR